MGITLDELGKWSEIKLQIIREYAKPYSQILAKQPNLYHVYIDGFAGAGLHVSRATGGVISGTPINVTSVTPKFREYHLVELDESKVAHLRKLFAADPSVHVHSGDSNKILLEQLLPKVQFNDYRRALCLLDPYGMQIDWRVVEFAGQLRTIDLLLNFSIMDMNMNALWHDLERVPPPQAARMTRFWGDESWRQASRESELTLFGAQQVKAPNEAVVRAYIERLKSKAGFDFVSEPLPMTNRTNAVVYYLLFASQKQTAHKIVSSIFKKALKELRQ